MSSPQAQVTIAEMAERTVEYVRRAVGVSLEYDSDTLPLLDHYLRSVPRDQTPLVELVVATAGAYFGEVVIRRLGGRWEVTSPSPTDWRVVLPTGVSFAPAGFVAVAIARVDVADVETGIEAPPRMQPHLERAMARMSELTTDEYFSLCGRLDTLEHVSEVLVAVAAQLLGEQVPAPDAEDGSSVDADEPGNPEAADGPTDPSDPSAPSDGSTDARRARSDSTSQIN